MPYRLRNTKRKRHSPARSRSSCDHCEQLAATSTPLTSSLVSTRAVDSAGEHVGHVDERVAAVVVGEALLVARLEPVVELLDQPLA